MVNLKIYTYFNNQFTINSGFLIRITYAKVDPKMLYFITFYHKS